MSLTIIKNKSGPSTEPWELLIIQRLQFTLQNRNRRLTEQNGRLCRTKRERVAVNKMNYASLHSSQLTA